MSNKDVTKPVVNQFPVEFRFTCDDGYTWKVIKEGKGSKSYSCEICSGRFNGHRGAWTHYDIYLAANR